MARSYLIPLQALEPPERYDPFGESVFRREVARAFADLPAILDGRYLQLDGSPGVTGDLDITGDVGITGDLDVTGDVTVDGTTHDVTGDVRVAGDIVINATSTMIRQGAQDDLIRLVGGNALNNGAEVIVTGPSHPTLPSAFRVRIGTTQRIVIDGNGITLPSLPTSNPGGSGRLWNDNGTLKIS